MSLILAIPQVSQTTKAIPPTVLYQTVKAESQDTIQEQIKTTYQASIPTNTTTQMQTLIDELSIKFKATHNPLYLYWTAYARYYNSKIYSSRKDKKNAYRQIKKAIEDLESIDSKNAEDHALLSMLYSSSCQYVTFPKVIFTSKKAMKHAEQALKQDNNNLRVYYVMANNDYYRPERHGGGKVVEKHALKALSIQNKKSKNSNQPTWGREEAYELIIKYYIKKKDIPKAKKYADQGLLEYPRSIPLNKLKQQIQ